MLNIVLCAIIGVWIPYYLTGCGDIVVVQTTLPNVFDQPKLADINEVEPNEGVIVNNFYKNCWFNSTGIYP